MIGSVVVREAPDSMFPLNGTNGTELIDVAARDARRVQVAVALTALVGLIQVLGVVMSLKVGSCDQIISTHCYTECV